MRTTAEILREYRDLARRAKGASIVQSNMLARREAELDVECRVDHRITLGDLVDGRNRPCRA